MRVLLDTHVWLWMVAAPERLPRPMAEVIAQRSTELYFSAASGWEIAIKHHLGKLTLPEHPRAFIQPRLLRDAVRELPVTLRHTAEVDGLPDHHNDPFDRLLIAQARAESLTLATVDARVRRYEGICAML